MPAGNRRQTAANSQFCRSSCTPRILVARKADEAAEALAQHIQRTTDPVVEFIRSRESA
jgi:predicted RecB family endonuclease